MRIVIDTGGAETVVGSNSASSSPAAGTAVEATDAGAAPSAGEATASDEQTTDTGAPPDWLLAAIAAAEAGDATLTDQALAASAQDGGAGPNV